MVHTAAALQYEPYNTATMHYALCILTSLMYLTSICYILFYNQLLKRDCIYTINKLCKIFGFNTHPGPIASLAACTSFVLWRTQPSTLNWMGNVTYQWAVMLYSWEVKAGMARI